MRPFLIHRSNFRQLDPVTVTVYCSTTKCGTIKKGPIFPVKHTHSFKFSRNVTEMQRNKEFYFFNPIYFITTKTFFLVNIDICEDTTFISKYIILLTREVLM